MILPLLAGLAGVLAGSFIAGLSWRWPQGRPWAMARSACDGCGRTLGPLELVPVLSFLLQRGRCRGCGAAIPRRHLAIELAGGLIAAIPVAVAPDTAGAAAILGLALLILFVLDAEHFWLPDVVVVPLLLLGLWLGVGPLEARLIGAAAGFASLWLVATLYRRVRGREGLGGGDPKLLAAIGAWTGWAALPLVLLGASLAGLGWLALAHLRGRAWAADTMVPLGALMAVAAWPLWLLLASGRLDRLLP